MKNYEKPIAEWIEFNIQSSIMTEDEEDYDPIFSEGVEDW